MRKIALLGASALVLALGAASASAEPSTAQIMSHGQNGGYTQGYHHRWVYEGRAAAVDGSAADSVILEQHGVR
jgi:opacity protein-like surface antigen